MGASRAFLQLDVFADRPGAGNPLAVVLDGRGLGDDAMQAFARWTNLSETTFLLPPTTVDASYRVRIFTPRQELPFAGHPSVGSAHAALEAGIVQARDGRLVQECAAGLLPVRVEGEGPDRTIHVRAPRATFSGADIDPGRMAAALAGAARGALPVCVGDNGPRFILVELATEADVRDLQPDLDAVAALDSANDSIGLAVFARAVGAPWSLAVRVFCPGDGIAEDPVTGSANAAIGAWLHERNALPARSYVASQGREVGRDGRVQVAIDDQGDAWIGGRTQTVVRGDVDYWR